MKKNMMICLLTAMLSTSALVAQTCYIDNDQDGYGDVTTSPITGQDSCNIEEHLSATNDDCDDDNITIHPNAIEIPGDNIDQDCDAVELCFLDNDDDGYRPDVNSTVPSTSNTVCTDTGEAELTDPIGDCNNNNSTIHPNASEIPDDGIDQDCNGFDAVTCYVDDDFDGYGSSTTLVSDNDTCLDAGESNTSDDCDDTNNTIHPNATEIPNDGIDQNCSGSDLVVDTDNDGIDDATEQNSFTDPQDADTDNDGLLDGEEDRNFNGIVDVNETDPRDADTDNDGLSDGEEDSNANGIVDANETNPLSRDSDADGLNDGLEKGKTVSIVDGTSDGSAPVPYSGTDSSWTPDTDQATTTDPLKADTDGDGLNDGQEDADHDGQ